MLYTLTCYVFKVGSYLYIKLNPGLIQNIKIHFVDVCIQLLESSYNKSVWD